MDETVTTVETYGNTAAASIPLTLQKAVRERAPAPAARGSCCAASAAASPGAPRCSTGERRQIVHSILITGAASGIGAGLAAELAAPATTSSSATCELDGAEARRRAHPRPRRLGGGAWRWT